MRHVDVDERRARLARRHRLAPGSRAADVVDVARDLVGLHATDPTTVYLSAMARMKQPSTAALEKALYDDRTLLRMLCMRRTLFVQSIDAVPVVQAAASAAVAKRERTRLVGQLEAAGISDNAGPWLRKVEKATLAALAKRGEATAVELSADVPALKKQWLVNEGKKYEAMMGVSGRVLLLLAADGRVVRGRPRGSWVSSQYRWATTDTWLGAPVAEMPTDVARAELARRWLQAFGPATVNDLKWWTGWNLGDTKKALAGVDTVEVELEGGVAGLLLADDVTPVRPPKPWVALLPALDPTTMGWKERGWYLGDHGPALFDTAGNAGPTVWCDGRIVGGWAQRKDGEIVLHLLEDIGKEAKTSVADEAERLSTLIGDVRYSTRFATPTERKLRA